MQTFLKDLSRRPVIASARDLPRFAGPQGPTWPPSSSWGTILTLRELAEGCGPGASGYSSTWTCWGPGPGRGSRGVVRPEIGPTA